MKEKGRRTLVHVWALVCLAALALTSCDESYGQATVRPSAAPRAMPTLSPFARPAPDPSSLIGLIDPAARRKDPRRPVQPALAPLPPPVSARLESPATPYATLRTEVRIRFDGPVRQSLVESLFRLEPQASGRLDWPEDRLLRFQPDRLAFDTNYVVALGAGGHAMWSWRFTTVKPFTITIDDCADSADQLHAILDVLAQRHITAIMFPTGFCQRRFPWLVPAMLAAGHRVCNHTDWHRHLTTLTDVQVATEIRNGVHAGCNLLRPPYGEWDARIERIAAAQGYRIFMWDVDTLDWNGADTASILERIYGRGGVILLHFHGRGTVEALRRLDLQN